MTGQTVRAALTVLASLALLPPATVVAQAPDPTPSGRELRDEYPLRATRQTAAGEAAVPAPRTTAEPPAGVDGAQSSGVDLEGGIAALVAILAFSAGFALAVRSFRWRGRGKLPDAAATVAAGPAKDRGQVQTKPRAWIAEIEWRATDGGARFHVVARTEEGDETLLVAESEPFEWPPSGAEAVAAMTAAAEALETRLLGAGWQPLAPGEAWYAMRFSWAPGDRQPARIGRFGRRVAGSERAEALWRDRSRALTVAGRSREDDPWTDETTRPHRPAGRGHG